MRELSPQDKSRLLIRATLGEDYGGGETVTNVNTHGFAEPGYGFLFDPETDVAVLGDWNQRSGWRNPEPSKADTLPVRLGEALERAGAELLWLDEWAECSNCYRLMRTVENSYHWRMYGAFVEYDYVCADCILADLADYLPHYVNDPTRCLTFGTSADLQAQGFEQWESSDPHTYESGWHPGQTDDPPTVYAQILREHDEPVEVVFLLDESSQFYVKWSAHVRPTEHDSASCPVPNNDYCARCGH